MSVQLRAQVASRQLDLSLDLATGETLALLGPNGGGKSSLLGLLAGLLRPDVGHAYLNGRVLFEVGSGPTTSWLPPHQRNVGLLAQEPLLFPHLTVAQNVAFGPRCRGQSRRAAQACAQQWLAEVDGTDLTDRATDQLSGGQAQRVALARALAADPELLLLDEPLVALDVGAAATLRHSLRRALVGRTAILVTHEILDAVLLADRIAIMDHGRIIEQGPTTSVMRHPRSAFAANICGLNMLVGTCGEEQSLRLDDGTVIAGLPVGILTRGAPVIAVFQPSAVSVHRTQPTGSPRNIFTGTITALEPQAHLIRVRMGDLCADITAAAASQLDLSVGTSAHFAVKAAEVSIYDA
jgi:molybdate transport system ATP-binding protein